jgi:hypothetical protein
MPALSYYWSASQSEYATDILFDQARELEKLYPKLLRHAITSFQSPDIMRFLGRKVSESTGKVHGSFEGQVSSGLKERAEGVRIRHSVNRSCKKPLKSVVRLHADNRTTPYRHNAHPTLLALP